MMSRAEEAFFSQGRTKGKNGMSARHKMKREMDPKKKKLAAVLVFCSMALAVMIVPASAQVFPVAGATGVCIGGDDDGQGDPADPADDDDGVCNVDQDIDQAATINNPQTALGGNATSGNVNVEANQNNEIRIRQRNRNEDNDTVNVGVPPDVKVAGFGEGKYKNGDKKDKKGKDAKKGKKAKNGGVNQANTANVTTNQNVRARSGDATGGDAVNVSDNTIGQAATQNATVGSGNNVGDEINCEAAPSVGNQFLVPGSPGCVFIEFPFGGALP